MDVQYRTSTVLRFCRSDTPQIISRQGNPALANQHIPILISTNRAYSKQLKPHLVFIPKAASPTALAHLTNNTRHHRHHRNESDQSAHVQVDVLG